MGEHNIACAGSRVKTTVLRQLVDLSRHQDDETNSARH